MAASKEHKKHKQPIANMTIAVAIHGTDHHESGANGSWRS
jgi:hypothetical protein